MKKVTILFFALLVALYPLLATQAEKQPRAKLTLSAESDKIFVGQTLQLRASCDDPSVSLASLVYTSSNPKRATIDANGLLTAVSNGSVRVTVKTADKKRTASLNIRIEAVPETITLKASKTSVLVDKKLTIRANVLPTAVKDRAITWTSSDQAIATVDERGTITGIGPGNVVITATSTNFPAVAATLEIQIIRLASSVTLNATPPSALVGATIPLTCLIEPADVSSREVTYSSNRPKIASVSEDGVVTALKAGKATITAKTKDGSRKRGTIVVEAIQPLFGISLPKEIAVGIKSHQTVVAKLEPKDATDKHITWVSDDPMVATVKGGTNNKATVTAHSWGKTRITATSDDGGYTASMIVKGGLMRDAVRLKRCYYDNDNKMRFVLRNESNMEIINLHILIKGVDANQQPVVMCDPSLPLPRNLKRADHPKGGFSKDPLLCSGLLFPRVIEPGKENVATHLELIRPTSFAAAETLSVAIVGYTYSIDQTEAKYEINEKHWKWVEVE